MKSKFTKQELLKRACFRAAFLIHGRWEETGFSDTAYLDYLIVRDELVHVGNSLKGTECREHVVPRVLICYEAHSMFADGATVEDVAKFIERHLKIVRISRPERKYLDGSAGMNLKEKMPSGWAFNRDSIYARLDAAGIEYRLFDERG